MDLDFSRVDWDYWVFLFVALNCSQYYKYKKRRLSALNFTKIVQINREIKILETSIEKMA